MNKPNLYAFKEAVDIWIRQVEKGNKSSAKIYFQDVIREYNKIKQQVKEYNQTQNKDLKIKFPLSKTKKAIKEWALKK